jgi:hypothetical protein
MGNLKPGASYIYERADGVTYAREIGADISTREAIGWQYDPTIPNFDPRTEDGRPLYDHITDSKLWGDIRRAAKTNPALQTALDNVKIMYHLSKDNGTK